MVNVFEAASFVPFGGDMLALIFVGVLLYGVLLYFGAIAGSIKDLFTNPRMGIGGLIILFLFPSMMWVIHKMDSVLLGIIAAIGMFFGAMILCGSCFNEKKGE